MYKLPPVLDALTISFERLPGIGPKTARRLSFYLLNTPGSFLKEFARSLVDLKEKVVFCEYCFNVGEESPCYVCKDESRKKNLFCVVEGVMDIVAIEKTGRYDGLYHVLGGVLNPLDHIGPGDLHIEELLTRVKKRLELEEEVEVLLATNPTMEGEATALYVKKALVGMKGSLGGRLLVSRIGSGLPVGADVGYADEVTLMKALEGRRKY